MKPKILNSSAGFTYVAVMVLVVIMGIMLAAAGETMYMTMQREREEELLFRGGQIQDAIEKWNKPKAGRHLATPLRDLEALIKDPREMANVRHLRRLYKDPMTPEGEWQTITDPVKGIVGVASTSGKAPIKQGNFPEKWKTFEGKTKYSDWQFVYGQQQQATTTPTNTSPFKQ